MNTVPISRLSEGRRLELLIDAIADYAIYMLDSEGFITSWNSGAQRLKGYRRIEIIGQHYSRFFTEEDKAIGLPAHDLKEAERAGRSESEGWRVRKDGSRFWADTVLEAIRSESGELIGYAKITRDVTERMLAQQALVESERRFRLLVEGAVDYAIYMLDPSGIVSNWNAGAERLKGYTADEIVGRHFSQFYLKEDRAAGMPARALHIAVRDGRYESEGWRVRKDGSRFWVSVALYPVRSEAGELLGFSKITRDITERRAAQEALRESERQLRLLVQGVTDYALYMLDPNGIVCSWNSGAARIKGYSDEEIIGQHFSRFYTEEDRLAGVPARALYTASQAGRYEAEAWRVRKDGSLFWANVIIDPIRDDTGRLVGFAKITKDLTERRQAQLAIEEARAKQAQAQKMEALGQLTGGVAHDFNNLLMIVSGYIQTLTKLVGDDPKGTRAIKAIEYAASRGQTLTRQLLSFSKRQVLNPVVSEIRERVEGLRPLLASSVGPSIELAPAIPEDLWPVEIDVSEFELSIINLTVNARDAMPDGGVITIVAENVHLDRGALGEDIEGEFVAITVADTGCGIAEDILPKVFDPFFTTKQASNGSGLGLSQVYGFAHQSEGTVVIDSTLGAGTRVTLYLPRARATPEKSTPNRAELKATGEVVLLVEDNPDVAAANTAMLQEIGYVVEAATDPQTALAAIERQTPDLVISDIVMAGPMNGLGLARVIRRKYPAVPVLLVTGYSEAMAESAAEFTVLRKPYQLAELSDAIAGVITEKQSGKGAKLVRLQDVRENRRPRDRQP